jgi:microcystin-dependent protein
MPTVIDGTTGIDTPAINAGNIVGEVCFFGMSTAPTGFLKANGAAVSRTTYAALFTAIGTTYGAGDGSTTFNLPDLRGEFPRGLDDGRGVDSGRAIGTAQGDAIRNITADMAMRQADNSTTMGLGSSTAVSGAFGISGAYSRRGVQRTDGNWSVVDLNFDASRVVPTANENRPRNVALLACIKF